jgi:hypothetical protein
MFVTPLLNELPLFLFPAEKKPSEHIAIQTKNWNMSGKQKILTSSFCLKNFKC